MRDKINFKLIRSLLCIILCLAMVVPFAGCKKQDAEDSLEQLVVTSAEDAIVKMADLGHDAGYENALSELTEKSTATIDGDSYYRLQQNYQGIPVYGRTVVCATDEDGNVTSVTGNAMDIDATIDVTPTVSREEVKKAIDAYLTDVLGCENTDRIKISDLKEYELYIYNLSRTQICLVYCVNIENYMLLVDAHSSDIVFVDCGYRFAESIASNLQGQHNTYNAITISTENDAYQLVDLDRSIETHVITNKRIWNWNSRWWISVWDSSSPVTWNAKEEPDPSAVDAYVNTQISYEYFSEVLKNVSADGHGKSKTVILTGLEYKPEEADDGSTTYKSYYNNAFSKTDKDTLTTYLVFGIGTDEKDDLSACLDTVAHEYMHSVEAFHSNMIYNGESGAIMEALSDIFGEMVEGWHTNIEPDWMQAYFRNIRDPKDTDNPYEYHGENWVNTDDLSNDNGGVHENSTVISHAAYLMWNGIDGDKSKMISTDDLAKLWYRAMLMMPSDCDFITCRKLVEYAAQSMDSLGEKQKECIRDAFDKVGIFLIDSEKSEWAEHIDYHLPKESEINVYVASGERCTNYTVNITGVTHSSTPVEISETESLPDEYVNKRLQARKFLNSAFNKSYSKTYEVNSNEAFPLDLPVGFYTIAISNQYSDAIYELAVCVGTTGEDDTIELYTSYQNPLVVVIPEELSSVHVTDTYYDEVHFDRYDILCCYHIPKIVSREDPCTAVNERIYNQMYSILQKDVYDYYAEKAYMPGIREMHYLWGQKDNLLSIVVRTSAADRDATTYYAYNIDYRKGCEVPAQDLLNAYGFTESEYLEKVKASIVQYFDRSTIVDLVGKKALDELIANSLADVNINTATPFISPTGDLCSMVGIYWPAGAGWYIQLFNLSGTTKVDAFSCVTDLSSEIIPPKTEKDAEYSTEENKYQVDDRFYFGSYEQDGNRSNGAEPIQWRVLATESDRILVISEKALECKPFYSEDITIDWKYSELRYWLNTDMYITAFSEAERKAILLSRVAAEANPQNNIDPGSDTSDYLFIPSISEMQQYFSSNNDRRCSATQYAINKGAYVDDGSTWWLLRNPGDAGDKVANVNSDGRIDYVGSRVENVNGGVRVMMWIGTNEAGDLPEVEPTVETTPEHNQDAPTWYVTEQGLLGKWSVDTKRTMDYNEVSMNDMFGRPYNDGMEFGEQGAFKYFITFYGGSGHYQISENHINYSIVTYDWGEQEQSGVIEVQVIDDTVYLIQNVLGYTVFWKRA